MKLFRVRYKLHRVGVASYEVFEAESEEQLRIDLAEAEPTWRIKDVEEL